MYKIRKAEKLASNIYSMVVEAPRVAEHCLPGQFIIAKMDEEGERIPLTICDYDREEGTITIVFQPIGASTEKFATLKTGDAFEDFVGPLGRPSELCTDDLEEVKKLKLLFVAGGVGTAPVYPQVKWLHEHGIDADVIVGAKTKRPDHSGRKRWRQLPEISISQPMTVLTEEAVLVTKVIEDLVAEGKQYDPLHRHRTDDHDEICLSDHQEAEYPHHCQHEPDHGRRYRYVRSLSCCCRRRGQICLRRRTGV